MFAKDFATKFPQASAELASLNESEPFQDAFILAIIFWHNVEINQRIDSISDALGFDIRKTPLQLDCQFIEPGCFQSILSCTTGEVVE